MDDGELVERAAKAAGIKLTPTGHVWDDATAEMVPWRPLEDDGDALRLLAQLRLVLNVSDGSAHAWKWNPGAMEPFSDHNGNEMAAVRRAIVREAANLIPKS